MDSNASYFPIDNSMSWKDVAKRFKQNRQTESQEDAHPVISSYSQKDTHGQLAIDIYQTSSDLIVQAPIAGIKPEDLDVSLHDDILTIRGKRERCEEIHHQQMIYQECHWGEFSRSVVLPMDVVAERVEATLKNGILTIRMPKAKSNKKIKIKAE